MKGQKRVPRVGAADGRWGRGRRGVGDGGDGGGGALEIARAVSGKQQGVPLSWAFLFGVR